MRDKIIYRAYEDFRSYRSSDRASRKRKLVVEPVAAADPSVADAKVEETMKLSGFISTVNTMAKKAKEYDDVDENDVEIIHGDILTHLDEIKNLLIELNKKKEELKEMEGKGMEGKLENLRMDRRSIVSEIHIKEDVLKHLMGFLKNLSLDHNVKSTMDEYDKSNGLSFSTIEDFI